MSKDGSPYLENFIPTDLDSKGNFEGVQLMFAGSESAAGSGGEHGEGDGPDQDDPA